jgi:hypothetical protein
MGQAPSVAGIDMSHGNEKKWGSLKIFVETILTGICL